MSLLALAPPVQVGRIARASSTGSYAGLRAEQTALARTVGIIGHVFHGSPQAGSHALFLVDCSSREGVLVGEPSALVPPPSQYNRN